MDLPRLRELLEKTLASQRPHAEKLTVSAAVISAVLSARGMQATLVGGAAIEFHAPGLYATDDVDLIVEGQSRAELDVAMHDLGFQRQGRHWVHGSLFVEVPGNWIADPVDVVSVPPLTLRVVKREIVLADRIIGFKHWGSTAYGAQALALLAVFDDSLDEDVLRGRLRSEHAEDALDALKPLVARDDKVTEKDLQRVLDQLRNPRRTGEADE